MIWFGTDRGVCRFDPNAPRVESIGDNAESNFVRTLYQTSDGRMLAGTNRGLFVYDTKRRRWNSCSDLARNIIYSIAEDSSGRLAGRLSQWFLCRAKASREDSAIESQSFTRLETGSGNTDASAAFAASPRFGVRPISPATAAASSASRIIASPVSGRLMRR